MARRADAANVARLEALGVASADGPRALQNNLALLILLLRVDRDVKLHDEFRAAAGTRCALQLESMVSLDAVVWKHVCW